MGKAGLQKSQVPAEKLWGMRFASKEKEFKGQAFKKTPGKHSRTRQSMAIIPKNSQLMELENRIVREFLNAWQRNRGKGKYKKFLP